MNLPTLPRWVTSVVIAVGAALVLVMTPVAMAQDPGPGDADRVTLRYADDQIELVGVTPLVTYLPPSDELPGSLGTVSGFWFELRSSEGAVRYRRVVGDPIRLVFEGPQVVQDIMRSAPAEIRLTSLRRRGSKRWTANGPVVIPKSVTVKRSATSTRLKTMVVPDRQEGLPDERVFTFLFPSAQQGDELVIFGAPIEVGNEADAAVELGRFSVGPTQ
jgi:hypothetical protein